jgi:hypothetical protein
MWITSAWKLCVARLWTDSAWKKAGDPSVNLWNKIHRRGPQRSVPAIDLRPDVRPSSVYRPCLSHMRMVCRGLVKNNANFIHGFGRAPDPQEFNHDSILGIHRTTINPCMAFVHSCWWPLLAVVQSSNSFLFPFTSTARRIRFFVMVADMECLDKQVGSFLLAAAFLLLLLLLLLLAGHWIRSLAGIYSQPFLKG